MSSSISFEYFKKNTPQIIVYSANLGNASNVLRVPILNLTFNISYSSSSAFSVTVTPSQPITVDIYKHSLYSSTGVDSSSWNNVTISSTTTIDNSNYNQSNESWSAWIRQLNPISNTWYTHEMKIFASASGARTTVWVIPIEKGVTYT